MMLVGCRMVLCIIICLCLVVYLIILVLFRYVVRVETGVEEGDIVSMYYDFMIVKFVVWGENRIVVLVKLKDCLLKF